MNDNFIFYGIVVAVALCVLVIMILAITDPGSNHDQLVRDYANCIEANTHRDLWDSQPTIQLQHECYVVANAR